MQQHNRRQFIKTLAAGSLAATIPFALKADRETGRSLTILHTNDVHSHLDPFDASHPRFPNMGGFARRGTLIGQLRKENPNLILLDAGDIFQGTPYFNFFGGEPEFRLMSQMKYDAATIGNHEFDNGMEHLAQQMEHARFPFISTNYEFKGTILEGKTKPWKIIDKGPFRVGLIGLGINPSGLVSPANYEGMKWLDPSRSGEETAKFLKEDKKCNLVIALSHLGFESTPDRPESDKKVASETSSIDVIIGGHSHTFMDEPALVKNKSGSQVIINQVGWAGVKLGQIDITFQKQSTSFAAVQHLIR
ncbi:MAG: bifunctional metallophosphatase/5'-nucleotidase [Marinilabiliaceae bacterium]